MFAVFIVAATVIIDHITKYFAKNLKSSDDILILGEKLKFSYVENRGAAFGILNNNQMFLNLLTIGITLILCIVLYRNYRKFSSFTVFCFSLIIGGSIGNLMDRIFRGYVIDFISYTFQNGYGFPVFNVADICVVGGCILMLISTFLNDDLEGVL